jgi:hypothetical protein
VPFGQHFARTSERSCSWLSSCSRRRADPRGRGELARTPRSGTADRWSRLGCGCRVLGPAVRSTSCPHAGRGARGIPTGSSSRGPRPEGERCREGPTPAHRGPYRCGATQRSRREGHRPRGQQRGVRGRASGRHVVALMSRPRRLLARSRLAAGRCRGQTRAGAVIAFAVLLVAVAAVNLAVLVVLVSRGSRP